MNSQFGGSGDGCFAPCEVQNDRRALGFAVLIGGLARPRKSESPYPAPKAESSYIKDEPAASTVG
jgi:hypothetical protein